MPSYVVQGRDPRRIATAVVLYQVRQPRFAAALVAVLAAFAVAGAFSGWRGSLSAMAFALVVVVLVTEYKRRQLGIVLAHRGFRPGSTVEATADARSLTISAVTGMGHHPWADIEHVRVIGRIVLFRLRAARFVVAVPLEALPAGTLERIAGPVRP